MLYVIKMKRVVARNSRTLPMVISPDVVDSFLNQLSAIFRET